MPVRWSYLFSWLAGNASVLAVTEKAGLAFKRNREGRGKRKQNANLEINKLPLQLHLFWGWVTHFLNNLFLKLGLTWLTSPFRT